MRVLTYSGIWAFALMLVVPARGDESRRLFDFAPSSATNPVVATIDRTIEIPLSELQAYREAERINAFASLTSIARKRALLEELINEYLSVDDAYRSGVAQSPGFLKRMDATRTMILTDILTERLMKEKRGSPAKEGDPVTELGERLFDAAVIDISNESYAVLRAAARGVDRASATQPSPAIEPARQTAERLRAIIDQTPEAVLVRYENKSISIHQLLAIYAGLPLPRPNLETHEGLLRMIKPFVIPELMAIEAMKRGIDREPAFQEKLIQNRNALLRFHMQGVVDRQANELMNQPDVESHLHAWYESHKTDYSGATPETEGPLPPYLEIRPRVEADYSVSLRDNLLAERTRLLRKTRSVQIDEKALGMLVVTDNANGTVTQSDSESRPATP